MTNYTTGTTLKECIEAHLATRHGYDTRTVHVCRVISTSLKHKTYTCSDWAWQEGRPIVADIYTDVRDPLGEAKARLTYTTKANKAEQAIIAKFMPAVDDRPLPEVRRLRYWLHDTELEEWHEWLKTDDARACLLSGPGWRKDIKLGDRWFILNHIDRDGWVIRPTLL